jgi:hypothetical protein
MIKDLGKSSIEILPGAQQRQLLDADLDRGSIIHREARAQAVQGISTRIQEEYAAHAVDASICEGLLQI